MAEYRARGKYFEDFVIGEEVCSPSRTVTEADIVNFAGLSGDYMQIHTSEQFAENTVLKGRIATESLISRSFAHPDSSAFRNLTAYTVKLLS